MGFTIPRMGKRIDGKSISMCMGKTFRLALVSGVIFGLFAGTSRAGGNPFSTFQPSQTPPVASLNPVPPPPLPPPQPQPAPSPSYQSPQSVAAPLPPGQFPAQSAVRPEVHRYRKIGKVNGETVMVDEEGDVSAMRPGMPKSFICLDDDERKAVLSAKKESRALAGEIMVLKARVHALEVENGKLSRRNTGRQKSGDHGGKDAVGEGEDARSVDGSGHKSIPSRPVEKSLAIVPIAPAPAKEAK